MINSFKDAVYETHFHSTYSISLVLEGKCDIVIEGKRYKILKNDIRVLNPFDFHSIKKSSWVHKNLIFKRDFIFEVLGKEAVFQNVIKDKKLASFLSKGELNPLDMREFIKILYHKYALKDKTLKIPESKKLQKAISYIEKNANIQDITIEKVAKYAGFSKYHFIREFKKEIGLTPYRYIHNLKINKANELLRSQRPPSLVAFECGFVDQSHFIKIYKKFYGHTPSKVSNNLLS